MNELIQAVNRKYLSAIQNVLYKKQIHAQLARPIYGSRNLNYLLRLDDSLKLDTILNLGEILAYEAQVEDVLTQRVKGWVSYQFTLPPEAWKSYKRGIHCKGDEIGVNDNGKAVKVDPNANGIGIFATTGAGKTFTSFGYLLAMMETYTPQQFQAILINPHRQFTEFTEGDTSFVTFKNSSHVLIDATTPEEIESAILTVFNEMQKRLAGESDSSCKWLLVIDEADSIATMNPIVEDAILQIAKMGRKAQVETLQISQTPTLKNIPARDLLNNKIVGKLDMRQNEVTQLLKEPIKAAALTLQGDNLLATPGKNIERFLTPRIGKEDFARLDRGNGILLPKTEIVTTDSKPGPKPKGFDLDLLCHFLTFGENYAGINAIAKDFGIGNDRVIKHRDMANLIIKRCIKLQNLREIQS